MPLVANTVLPEDIPAFTRGMLAAHQAGRAAIKAVGRDLPVGITLSMFDDQAAGKHSIRDAKRAELYGAWLESLRGDDFIDVQNYERKVCGPKDTLPPPPGARLNMLRSEVLRPSLANAVSYGHAATIKPNFMMEHGVGADDDTIRAWLIPAALKELKAVMDRGVPVIGYLHWSLLDNYEWGVGREGGFGLFKVDRATFRRTFKPIAAVLSAIAHRNAV